MPIIDSLYIFFSRTLSRITVPVWSDTCGICFTYPFGFFLSRANKVYQIFFFSFSKLLPELPQIALNSYSPAAAPKISSGSRGWQTLRKQRYVDVVIAQKTRVRMIES